MKFAMSKILFFRFIIYCNLSNFRLNGMFGNDEVNVELLEMKVVKNELDKAYRLKRTSSGSSVIEMDKNSRYACMVVH